MYSYKTIFLQRNIFLFVAISFTILICSCKTKDSNNPLHPYENNLGIKPSLVAQIDTLHYTTIQWISPVKNIGRVNEGDKVTMKFWYLNTGEHPLFISKVKPACGCTLPQFSEAATMPGERNFLLVDFNTNGQAGDIDKSIIVTTNTSNGVNHQLIFQGRVDSLQKR